LEKGGAVGVCAARELLQKALLYAEEQHMKDSDE